MKRFLLVLAVIMGALTAGAAYERLFVERTIGPSALLTLAILGGLFLAVLVTFLLYETRHRETLANIWLATISVVGSYIILDLAAGFFLIRPLSPPLVPDPLRHHKPVPNSYVKFEQQDFSYVQRVNNLGLRGPDVSLDKPPNTYRILMLGDSFTMGKGVNDDQTASVLLEQSLKQSMGACNGKSVQVLNGGVDSYAPVLSFLQLRTDLEPLKPDVVVLNLDLSDLVQEDAYRKEAVYAADGQVAAVPQRQREVSTTERVREWTDRHLFLTRALLFYVNGLFKYRDLNVRNVVTQANVEVIRHSLSDDTEDRTRQWENIFRSIRNIKDFTAARSIGFVLSIYPWAHQISDTEWMPGRYSYMTQTAVASDNSVNTIKELAAKNGIQLADLYPTFRAYRGKDLLYFHHDPHLTPAGHQIMAKGLHEHVANLYLTSWCR